MKLLYINRLVLIYCAIREISFSKQKQKMTHYSSTVIDSPPPGVTEGTIQECGEFYPIINLTDTFCVCVFNGS
jgi:hypothetical protein